MAESPLATLARILTGVALVQGRFAHQVLGQLLIANTNDAAIATAAVVVAGTSRTRNAAAQVALRTAAPAIAVHTILQREEQRLKRLDDLMRERQRQDERLGNRVQILEREKRTLEAKCESERASLRDEIRSLEEDKNRLTAQLAGPLEPTPRAAPRAARATKRRAPAAKPPTRPPKKPRR